MGRWKWQRFLIGEGVLEQLFLEGGKQRRGEAQSCGGSLGPNTAHVGMGAGLTMVGKVASLPDLDSLRHTGSCVAISVCGNAWTDSTQGLQ